MFFLYNFSGNVTAYSKIWKKDHLFLFLCWKWSISNKNFFEYLDIRRKYGVYFIVI